MSQIVAGKKNRKKRSAFEKLWDRAAKLKSQNEKFSADLDALVARVETTIKPREAELARQQIPLLQKLVTLGQRKSMTKWERETLDEWIQELAGAITLFGFVTEELMDDLAHYDAFRMGVSLEDESIPPHQQFVEIMQQAEKDQIESIERKKAQRQETHTKFREQMIREAEQKVERELDKILGPAPAQPEKHSMTQDLWADELDAEQQRQSAEYQKRRAELRAQLMEQSMDEIDDSFTDSFIDDEDDEFDDEFDDFDFSAFEEAVNREFGSDEPQSQSEPNAALSNETFQRLFRATAGKLHPDREPDSEARKEKQKLMVALLKARKKGDVMTVLEMYKTHVGEHEGFSKADQKSLVKSLEQMIEDLEDQKEEIMHQSSLHATIYHVFYSPEKKKVDAAFTRRIEEIKDQEKTTAQQIKNIRSLKTLKPELEKRYDELTLSEPSFEDFMRFVVDDNYPF